MNTLCRHRWGARSSSRRHVMYASYCGQYHRYRYLLDTFLSSQRSRLHRGFARALGTRILSLFLWVVHLARVWDHVSPKWWRKGLPGGCLSEAKISCHRGVCCECDLAWIHREWVYRKCQLSTCASAVNSGWSVGLCEQVGCLVELPWCYCDNALAFLLRRERLQRFGLNVVLHLEVFLPTFI